MELFILWVGFAGAWLLVVGPVYQASVELRAEELDREGIQAAAQNLTPPRRISPWWWFIPPVAYILTQRAQSAYRQAAFATLNSEQREQFVGFTQKAQGWLIVALGACLIAVKETWELAEASEWWPWVFWVLIFLMPVLCLIYTVYTVIAGQRQLGHDVPGRPARGAGTRTTDV